MGVGMVLIFGAGNKVVLAPFVLFYGLSLGAPLVLIPLLQAESLGLKRFGSIAGITGFVQTIGATLGPSVAGRIFDVTHSYSFAFEIFGIMCAIGAVATTMCLTLDDEQARLGLSAAKAPSAA